MRDAESDNDYAGARYYANAAGRWLGVDPAMGDLSDPQDLNRFAYVRNDPVNRVDVDGRRWKLVNCGADVGKEAGGGWFFRGGYTRGIVCQLEWHPRSQPLGLGRPLPFFTVSKLSQDCLNQFQQFLADERDPGPPAFTERLRPIFEALAAALSAKDLKLVGGAVAEVLTDEKGAGYNSVWNVVLYSEDKIRAFASEEFGDAALPWAILHELIHYGQDLLDKEPGHGTHDPEHYWVAHRYVEWLEENEYKPCEPW